MEKRHRTNGGHEHDDQSNKDDVLPNLRGGRTRLLDELGDDHGYARKYAIKLLGDAVPGPGGWAQSSLARQFEDIGPIVRVIRLAFGHKRSPGKGRAMLGALNCSYFLASGVTVSVTRWPSRRTTTCTGWPIFTASIA